MVEEGASKGDEGRDAAAGANEDQVKNAVAFLTHPKVSCSLLSVFWAFPGATESEDADRQNLSPLGIDPAVAGPRVDGGLEARAALLVEHPARTDPPVWIGRIVDLPVAQPAARVGTRVAGRKRRGRWWWRGRWIGGRWW